MKNKEYIGYFIIINIINNIIILKNDLLHFVLNLNNVWYYLKHICSEVQVSFHMKGNSFLSH